jgi:hypothetical protein
MASEGFLQLLMLTLVKREKKGAEKKSFQLQPKKRARAEAETAETLLSKRTQTL